METQQRQEAAGHAAAKEAARRTLRPDVAQAILVCCSTRCPLASASADSFAALPSDWPRVVLRRPDPATDSGGRGDLLRLRRHPASASRRVALALPVS